MHNPTTKQLEKSQRYSLLIIDDEEAFLRSLKIELRGNYDIYTAASIEQALEILRQQQIHIMLVDERLSDASGSEFLSKIKVDFPQTIRILCSGYTDTQVLQKAINNSSVFKFIYKPWDPSELQSILDAAVKHYQANEHNLYTDTLTKLKSAAILYDLLAREIKRCQRYKRKLSCVMLDVDKLSLINECHGFYAGDLVLKKVAEFILLELRESDYAGRLEEDNFLILLSETGKKGGTIFMERMLGKLNSNSFNTANGTIQFKINSAMIHIAPTSLLTVDDVLSSLNDQLTEFL